VFDATTRVLAADDHVVIDAPAWPWWSSDGTTWRRSAVKGAAFLLVLSVPTLFLATRMLEFGRVVSFVGYLGVLLVFGFFGILYFGRVSLTFDPTGISKRFYTEWLSAPSYVFVRWSKVRGFEFTQTSGGCRLDASLETGRAVLVPHMSDCDVDALISVLNKIRAGSVTT